MTQVQVHQPGRCTGLWPASRRESKSTQQNRNRWECVCTATNSFSRRGVYLSSLTGILSLPAPCACSWQGPASKQNCPGPRGLPQPLIRQSTHLQSEEPTCLVRGHFNQSSTNTAHCPDSIFPKRLLGSPFQFSGQFPMEFKVSPYFFFYLPSRAAKPISDVLYEDQIGDRI